MDLYNIGVKLLSENRLSFFFLLTNDFKAYQCYLEMNKKKKETKNFRKFHDSGPTYETSKIIEKTTHSYSA